MLILLNKVNWKVYETIRNYTYYPKTDEASSTEDVTSDIRNIDDTDNDDDDDDDDDPDS